MENTRDEYFTLVAAYWDRFNRPPFLFTTLDEAGRMEAMRRALESGEPIPTPQAPPGALI